MEITNVEVITVGERLETPLRWGAMSITYKGATLVEIRTDENITGIGEAGFSCVYSPWITLHINQLTPLLVGQDPFNLEKIWQEMFDATHLWGRRGMETYAISGIELALWDIIGKACKKPVYQILGGYKNRVRAYAAPSLKKPDEVEKECMDFITQGFTAVKLRVGLGLDQDLELVRRVRETVGSDVELIVDGNMAYTHTQAVKIAAKFDRYNITFFEEPVKARSKEEYVRENIRLKKKIDIPLSGGECFFTRYEFGELLSKQAVDIVQPDATAVGGILEAKTIGKMADTWGIDCIPHIACSSVTAYGLSANLQVICSLPNSPLVEYDPYETSIRSELVRENIAVENGFVSVPDRPGLGLELDKRAAKKYDIKKRMS